MSAAGAVPVRIHQRNPNASGASLAADGGLDAASRVREEGLSVRRRRKVGVGGRVETGLVEA